MDVKILNKYYEDGLLIRQTHPSLPLTIWNYSPKVQYGNIWDEITEQCRGLVTDGDGNIVARPFSKFWNLEEHDINELPVESFEVTEKMDGSLIIGFFYGEEFVIGSRGSFTSAQAIDARKILVGEMGVDPTKLFKRGHTYLFEYIAPHNRIVVNYGDVRKLVPLTIIHTDSMEEYTHKMIQDFYCPTHFEVVKIYGGITDFKILKSQIDDNAEGFVVRFKSGLRVKIKGEEYVRLHRIVTNVSNRTIWEYLSENKNFDEILERVPDEFYNWVKSTKQSLIDEYHKIEDEYKWIFKLINRAKNTNERKVFASYATKYKYFSLLFLMYDKKEYSKHIWGLVYPNHDKPFSKNGLLVD
jgi:RNA ligase